MEAVSVAGKAPAWKSRAGHAAWQRVAAIRKDAPALAVAVMRLMCVMRVGRGAALDGLRCAGQAEIRGNPQWQRP